MRFHPFQILKQYWYLAVFAVFLAIALYLRYAGLYSGWYHYA
jgi:hypothetical protein